MNRYRKFRRRKKKFLPIDVLSINSPGNASNLDKLINS
jgi:hypothetical protein